jgi:beta-galactosidase
MKPDEKIAFPVPREGVTLDTLIENLGRTNYGPDLADRKGITEAVLHGCQQLFGWTMVPLALERADRLAYHPAGAWQGPAFYRGRFVVRGTPADTFLAVPGGRHGVCRINGFLLGRYWERGPQRTLYVPAPVLREGENTLIVFETDGWSGAPVEFRDTPDLG